MEKYLKLVVYILWIIVGLVGCIWLLWNIYAVVSGRNLDIVVPYVVGMEKDKAEELLRSIGLEVEIKETSSSTVKAGVVISQNPQSGRKVKAKKTVTLEISSGRGKIILPDWKGKNWAEVKDYLTNSGIKFSLKEVFSAQLPQGVVVNQNPEAGKELSEDDTLIIEVSSGPPPTVSVPELNGLSLIEVKAKLEEAGLKLGRVIWIGSPESSKEVVFEQVPAKGEKVSAGSAVSLKLTYPAGVEKNDIVFQLNPITLILPPGNMYEVKIVTIDNNGKSIVYQSYHRGEEKVELLVPLRGKGEVEIYLNEELCKREEF